MFDVIKQAIIDKRLDNKDIHLIQIKQTIYQAIDEWFKQENVDLDYPVKFKVMLGKSVLDKDNHVYDIHIDRGE